MPSCSAPFCKNSTYKGFRLFRFPSDDERRKIWVMNCRRDNWTPTANSKLCEVHFEETEFENHRADGRIFLRWNAIPTIFDGPTIKRKSIKKKSTKSINTSNNNNNFENNTTPEKELTRCCETPGSILPEHSYFSNIPPTPEPEPIIETANVKLETVLVKAMSRTEDSHLTAMNFVGEITSLPSSPTSMKDFKSEESLELIKLQNEVKLLKRKLRDRDKQLECLGKNISSIMNEDQLMALSGKPPTKWSRESLEKAICLRLAVGQNGYEYLIKSGYPFPSARTLKRNIHSLHEENVKDFQLEQE